MGPYHTPATTFTSPTWASGFSPLDRRLGIPDDHLTPRVKQTVLEEVAQTTYRKAATGSGVPGLELSPARVGRMVQAEGEKLAQEQFGVEAAQAASQRRTENPAVLVVESGDGSRYRTNEADRRKKKRKASKANGPAQTTAEDEALSVEERDRGWRENKIGLVIRAEPGYTDAAGKYHAPQELLKNYVATTGPISELERRLEIENDRCALRQAKEIVWVGDHGHGLPGMVARLFKDLAVQIITDFYHVCARLMECAQLLCGTAPAAKRPRRRFYHRLKRHLWRGQVGRILELLRAQVEPLAPRPERLADLADRPEVQKVWEHIFYLEKHQDTMNYPYYRERGWPLSSAMMESACGQIGQRLKHNRMRWTRRNAEALHQIMATMLCQDGRWQQRWPPPIPVLDLPRCA